MLNVLAFVFIGLQIRPILIGLDPAVRIRYFWVAGAVLATVIGVRIAWVTIYYAGVRLCEPVMSRREARARSPSFRGVLIVGWSGMRGIVTLAAALALPIQINGRAFPFRDLIVFTAFAVVLGTLVIQGLTLGPLLRAFALRDDRPVEREVAAARDRALQRRARHRRWPGFRGRVAHSSGIRVASASGPRRRPRQEDGSRKAAPVSVLTPRAGRFSTCVRRVRLATTHSTDWNGSSTGWRWRTTHRREAHHPTETYRVLASSPRSCTLQGAHAQVDSKGCGIDDRAHGGCSSPGDGAYRAHSSHSHARPDGARQPRMAGSAPSEAARCSSRPAITSCPSSWSQSGEVEIVRRSDGGRRSIAVLGPGQFTGEVNMLSGRRALVHVRARARTARSIEVDREHLLALVQTDAELSEILMRAFILRRVELIARGLGDVVLIGSTHSRRHAAHQGVPDPQRPSLHLHRSRSRRRTSRSCSIAFTSRSPTCRC